MPPPPEQRKARHDNGEDLSPSPSILRRELARQALDIRGQIQHLRCLETGDRIGAVIGGIVSAGAVVARRTQAAEEMAAKIGTKLVFPLILCLWPSFFLVAIGPAIIGVLKVFGKV